MALFALGINHNTAHLDIREKVAVAPEDMERALCQAIDRTGLDEIAILSTCNRTELYCCGEVEAAVVLSWLAEFRAMPLDELSQAHYLHLDMDAARHIMKVASGLDSMVLGEPQILGQMKACFSLAKEFDAIGSTLHDLFQRVFSTAKRIRSETAIGENPVSVAYAAVALAQQIFSDLKQGRALLIGAGETIELVARHLKEQGIKELSIANRTIENALALAEKFSAKAILLSDIPEHLHEADIIISSTASQLPILGKGAVEAALKKRKHQPMFMVDIAVPRDIEPQVDELSDVFLYTVDDLKEVIDENMRSREVAAKKAMDIVEDSIRCYENDLKALTVVDTLKEFRQSIEGLKGLELEKASKALASGAEPQEVLENLARGLTNKFLHSPTASLKKAGATGRKDIIKIFQDIFNISTK